MGRGIDRLAATVLAAFAIYLFFLNASGRILPALIATFIAMALMRRLLAHIPTDIVGRKRRALRSAEDTLEQLALADPEAARDFLNSIVRSAYNDMPDGAAAHHILRHPSSALTADDIISIWRRHPDAAHVLAISLPKADETALSLASRLRSPEIAVIDRAALARIIASADAKFKSDSTYIKEYIPERRRVRILRAASRARAGKCALTGALMLALYLLTGTIPYIIGSLVLLFIAGVSAKHRRAPAGLFTQ